MEGNVKEITLSTGIAVRCKPVPPFSVTDIVRVVTRNRPDLQMPPRPTEKIEGAAGTTEAYVRMGTPEYDEWWAKCQEVDERLREEREGITHDLGIVEWKFPDSEEWSSDPPKKWKLPESVTDYGVKPREGKKGKRIDFIRHELLTSPKDVTDITDVIFGPMAPITEEEIAAISGTFPGEGLE